MCISGLKSVGTCRCGERPASASRCGVLVASHCVQPVALTFDRQHSQEAGRPSVGMRPQHAQRLELNSDSLVVTVRSDSFMV